MPRGLGDLGDVGRRGCLNPLGFGCHVLQPSPLGGFYVAAGYFLDPHGVRSVGGNLLGSRSRFDRFTFTGEYQINDSARIIKYSLIM